jgi:hypothetical protein
MNTLSFLVAGICTASFVMAQGTVFQVNTSGPITDIQTAVNMAGNGDLIEVAPGTYPAFSVVGKQLAVVGLDPITHLPATFSVLGAASTPAIQVHSLTIDQLVTISGARINHTNSTAPAIVIANNPLASVRLFDVAVTTFAALGNVPYDGLVELANTRAVWFDRVRVGDHRIYGVGSSGSGVAGLLCDATSLHLMQCDFRGMRSSDAYVPGGDGLRLLGTAPTWLVDTVLYGGMSLAGAVPNTLGGHAVHDLGGQAGPIRACDCALTPIVDTVSIFAVAGVTAFLAACSDVTVGRTSLMPATSVVRIGTVATVAVSANVTNRLFVLMIGEGFDHLQVPGLFAGAFLYSGNSIALTGGLLGATPFLYPLNLPNVPAAIGMHLTMQSGLIDPSGSLSTWSMSTAAGFMVR